MSEEKAEAMQEETLASEAAAEETVTTEEAAEELAAENAPETEAGTEAETEPAAEEKKKKLFGRGDKNEKALKEAEAKNAELTDQLQRQLAEFDNFRKRSEKEKAAQFDMGARHILEKLLPVADSFERGLGGLTEEQKEADAFASGMDKVYKQLLKMLEDLEVKPIEAVGQTFDANFHYAVMHEEDPEQGENVITQELQKGYLYKNTVIRYSMVKVAN